MKKRVLLNLVIMAWVTTGCWYTQDVATPRPALEGMDETTSQMPSPILARSDIIKLAPSFLLDDGREFDGSRLYTELGLTSNGWKDIIISDALHTGGRGGITWNVYLCVGPNQYRGPVAEIGGWTLAVEDDEYGNKRIWTFWYMSGTSGHISYLYYDIGDGKWKVAPPLEIYSGDGGSGIGNSIFDAIFNEHTRIPMRKISPASPTNDLPYQDTAWEW